SPPVKVAARIVIVVVLCVGVAGVVWVFVGSAASDRVVGNANVVGGVAGVLAGMLTVAVLWPRVSRRRAGAGVGGGGAVLGAARGSIWRGRPCGTGGSRPRTGGSRLRHRRRCVGVGPVRRSRSLRVSCGPAPTPVGRWAGRSGWC